jgi:Lon protease-like protein
MPPRETRVLPMFPLGTVLLPHAMLPLHVFEPRYRLMTRRVLRDDGEFGVVLIERGSEVGGGDTRFGIGTVARIVRAQELPDGGYALATVGIRRIRVVQWLADDPYPQASVVDLPDPRDGVLGGVDGAGADPDADAAAGARAVAALDDLCALYRRADPRIPDLPAIGDSPEQASYEIAALAPIGPLDTQRVLEVERAADRLALLAELLDEHARVLRAGDALE